MPINPSTKALLVALIEASLSREGGEVVARCGKETGRIFFYQGKVAWVVASTVPETFSSYLLDNSPLTSEELEKVYEECKHFGTNFGETIVQWGLLDKEALRKLLLRHISRCFRAILLWPKVSTLFMPENRSYKGNLTFDLADLLKEAAALNPGKELPFDATKLQEIKYKLLQKKNLGRSKEFQELSAEGEDSDRTQGNDRSTEVVPIGAKGLGEKLAELNGLEGLLGAGVFSGQGVLLSCGSGSQLQMDMLGALLSNLIVNARKTAQQLGFGPSDSIDIVTEEGANIFVRCHGEGATGFSLIVVCSKDARAGMVQLRIGQLMSSVIDAVFPTGDV
jgi:predicted regulator of Ras-like GTPase activity (Roadblock/LC7/MglB family)